MSGPVGSCGAGDDPILAPACWLLVLGNRISMVGVGQGEILTFSAKTRVDAGFVRERGYFFPSMVAASGPLLEGDWN